jgi:hypothetical protein
MGKDWSFRCKKNRGGDVNGEEGMNIYNGCGDGKGLEL